jgi:hypothetical protein
MTYLKTRIINYQKVNIYKLTVIYHWPILRKNVSVVKWFACLLPVRYVIGLSACIIKPKNIELTCVASSPGTQNTGVRAKNGWHEIRLMWTDMYTIGLLFQ